MKKAITFCIIIIILSGQLFARNTADTPYVLIASFDGFRWDYPDRGLTPNLTELAREGVRALSLQPCFPSKTFPNHYSIVTGLYPQNHGLIGNHFLNSATGERYQLSDSNAVKDDRWYQGEAIWASATREGIKSASFFWPGSETRMDFKHPTYYRAYDHHMPHEKRIQGILDWLQLPEEKRPHLLFLYFSDTDTQGHRFGPDSDEINDAIALLDKSLGSLRSGLKKIGLADKMNLIVLSDHGMTKLDKTKTIDLSVFPQLANYRLESSNPMVQIFVKDPTEKSALIADLRKNAAHFSVYAREDMPERYHYRYQPFIGDVILLAENGYAFRDSNPKYHLSRGDHGYDNFWLDMHGLFIAAGPAFKKGYRTGTVQNVDIYPLLCKILGIYGNQKIDGRLDRIDALLK